MIGAEFADAHSGGLIVTHTFKWRQRIQDPPRLYDGLTSGIFNISFTVHRLTFWSVGIGVPWRWTKSSSEWDDSAGRDLPAYRDLRRLGALHPQERGDSAFLFPAATTTTISVHTPDVACPNGQAGRTGSLCVLQAPRSCDSREKRQGALAIQL